MNLILMGLPGAGKGTQAEKIIDAYHIPHISTGDMFRAAMQNETALGLEAKSYIDKGELVPVSLVASIIKDRLAQEDCKNGYILDGYPRSVEQADLLEEINKEIDGDAEADFRAIYFDLDTEILISRIVNRRSCPKCGEIYNLKFKPTKVEGICDKCGTELTQRKDDYEETAKARFDTYFKETAPLFDYYKNKNLLKTINAEGSIDEVWERLLKVIND